MKQSTTSAVVQAAVAVLLGLFALPAAASGGVGVAGASEGGLAPAAIAWLVGGLLVSAWLRVCAPSLAQGTAKLLERLVAPEGSSSARQSAAQIGTGVAARWIIAVIEVVLIQAVLRRPVVAVVGTLTDPSTVDASFAAGSLILLIITLIWLHRTARPIVEAATWQALDALVATSGSERAQALADEADTRLATTERGVSLGGESTVPRESADPTVAAASATATRLATSATIRAPVAEQTRLATAAETTRLAPDAATRDAESTLAAPSSDGEDATILDPNDGSSDATRRS